MNLLLDTHAFLWFIANDPRLSSQAQSLIQAPANRRLLSNYLRPSASQESHALDLPRTF